MHKTTLPRSFCNVISLHFKIGCGWRSLFGINPFRINKTNFCPNMGWKKSKLKKLLWGDINKQKLLRMCAFISSSSFIFFISASTSSSQRYIFTPPPIIRGQILFRCSIFFFSCFCSFLVLLAFQSISGGLVSLIYCHFLHVTGCTASSAEERKKKTERGDGATKDFHPLILITIQKLRS